MASVDAVFRKIQRDAARDRMRNSGQTRKSVEVALAKTVRQPKGIEISYAGFLVSGQRSINKAIREQLAAMNSILDIARRTDSPKDPDQFARWYAISRNRQDDLSDDIVAAFNALKALVAKVISGTEGVLRLGIADHGAKTSAFNAAKYDSPVMNLLGIGNSSATVERSILKGWVTENTQLVVNMNVEQLGKLETLFLRALRDGTRSAQLEADVGAILGGSVNRARLIARDQIGKLNGQLDRQKQTEAGLDSYIWRGALDERERPTHVAREGDVFLWSNPPPDGSPGQPVQCRCSPEPNLAPLLGPEFAAEPVTAADLSKATPAARARNRREQDAKRRRRARRAARQVAT